MNTTGKELFDIYTSKEGEYKQILLTAFLSIGEDLYAMLEKAEKHGKRIALKDSGINANDSPISVVIE